MREGLLSALSIEMHHNPEIVVMDADVGTSTGINPLAKRFPGRYLRCGIAEQHTVAMAAGIAAAGMVPVVCAFAAFLVRRAFDQIVTSVCSPNLPVILCGGYSGLSSGRAGATHHAIEDIAVLRSVPGLRIYSPYTQVDVSYALNAAIIERRPAYLRISKDSVEKSIDSTPFGKGLRLFGGHANKLVVTHGTSMPIAIAVVKRLRERGMHFAILQVTELKPFNLRKFSEILGSLGIEELVTLEDHSVVGGLGDIILDAINGVAPHVRVVKRGVPDCFLQSGSVQELRESVRITEDAVMADILARSSP